jgi:anthranilate/para-aminobenzoate synthase component I
MKKLHRRLTDLPPDPTRIAQTLADAPGGFWLDSTAPHKRAILGAFPIDSVKGWDPEPSLVPRNTSSGGAPIPRWIGVIPYDACREAELSHGPKDLREPSTLREVMWWRYGAVVIVDRDVTVVGDDESAVNRLFSRITEPPRPFVANVSAFSPNEADSVHIDRIRQVLDLIGQGELYQCNLARGFYGKVEGSAFGLYRRLFGRAKVPFGFALELPNQVRILGASPELCLEHRANGLLVTRPIKGTRPRGRDFAEDADFITDLASDPKELAELNMVVDLERNDLGRVSTIGSVEVLSPGEIETYETLHHRVATVRSFLSPSVSREELLRAFLPSGSVTGTPKIAAMQQIARLERQRRGLYTGALGYLSHGGELCLAMAIRTLAVESDGSACYLAGGGIVADSQPEREVLETRWKSEQLFTNSAGALTTLPQSLAENWADWLGSSTEEHDRISRSLAPSASV